MANDPVIVVAVSDHATHTKMDAVKAVCTCCKLDEGRLVLAVRRGRLQFVDRWGFFTWLMVTLLTLLTGGFWLGFIAGWHVGDLVNPKYHCNRCDKIVEHSQFRP